MKKINVKTLLKKLETAPWQKTEDLHPDIEQRQVTIMSLADFTGLPKDPDSLIMDSLFPGEMGEAAKTAVAAFHPCTKCGDTAQFVTDSPDRVDLINAINEKLKSAEQLTGEVSYLHQLAYDMGADVPHCKCGGTRYEEVRVFSLKFEALQRKLKKHNIKVLTTDNTLEAIQLRYAGDINNLMKNFNPTKDTEGAPHDHCENCEGEKAEGTEVP